MLFSEHPGITTMHWLERPMMHECYNLRKNEPVICSGTVMGTKTAIIQLFRAMGSEYERLRRLGQCKQLDGIGVDQPLLNSMYYNGDIARLKNGNVEVLKYREGPVLTAGIPGSPYLKQYEDSHFTLPSHRDGYMERFDTVDKEMQRTEWQQRDLARLKRELMEVNGESFSFVNNDGKPAAVVHQWDRFGVPFFWRIDKQVNSAWSKAVAGDDQSFVASNECPTK